MVSQSVLDRAAVSNLSYRTSQIPTATMTPSRTTKNRSSFKTMMLASIMALLVKPLAINECQESGLRKTWNYSLIVSSCSRWRRKRYLIAVNYYFVGLEENWGDQEQGKWNSKCPLEKLRAHAWKNEHLTASGGGRAQLGAKKFKLPQDAAGSYRLPAKDAGRKEFPRGRETQAGKGPARRDDSHLETHRGVEGAVYEADDQELEGRKHLDAQHAGAHEATAATGRADKKN